MNAEDLKVVIDYVLRIREQGNHLFETLLTISMGSILAGILIASIVNSIKSKVNRPSKWQCFFVICAISLFLAYIGFLRVKHTAIRDFCDMWIANHLQSTSLKANVLISEFSASYYGFVNPSDTKYVVDPNDKPKPFSIYCTECKVDWITTYLLPCLAGLCVVFLLLLPSRRPLEKKTVTPVVLPDKETTTPVVPPVQTGQLKDYFIAEYEAWLKSYEVQFTHFMGIFYLWLTMVTFPATAGLIATQHQLSQDKFALLLYFLALLGFFLLAKMSDIRCSQLKYVRNMNEARYRLYEYAKQELPTDYNPPFAKNINVRKIALMDFGLIMAIIMSAVNSAYIGYALYLNFGGAYRSLFFGALAWGFGVLIYFCFVWFKLRPPKR